jgi:hypothetical protein
MRWSVTLPLWRRSGVLTSRSLPHIRSTRSRRHTRPWRLVPGAAASWSRCSLSRANATRARAARPASRSVNLAGAAQPATSADSGLGFHPGVGHAELRRATSASRASISFLTSAFGSALSTGKWSALFVRL